MNKKKLNSSLSLNKTITRGPTPHSKSFLLESAQHNRTYLPKQTSSKNTSKHHKSHSHSKPSSSKPQSQQLPKYLNLTQSISNIQQSKKYCSKMSSELQSSIIGKTIKINKMLRELHHFSVCLDDLKWLLRQGDKIVEKQVKKMMLTEPESTFTKDLEEVGKEFRSLVLRFGTIEKISAKGIEQILACNYQKDDINNQEQAILSMFQEPKTNPEQKYPSLPQNLTTIKELQTQHLSSFGINLNLPTQHFSQPLKENTNRSNLSNQFQNIKIIPSKQIKQVYQQPSPYTSEQFEPYCQNNNNNYQKQCQQAREEQLELEKDNLYSKLKQEYLNNQQLSGKIEMLRDQLQMKENKISKFRVLANRSVQQLGQILRKLVNGVDKNDKDFQLLKMAQCLNNWEKMMEEDQEQIRYQALYGDCDVASSERTKKLEEIIGLQYQINTLLDQKKSLEHQNALNKNQNQSTDLSEDFYRMLAVQAVCLEQLCS